MAIVGARPSSGVRIDVARPPGEGPPWTYSGEAATPKATYPLRATISEPGAVAVDAFPPGAPAGLAERARLILRAAWRHAREGGAPPARRIVRWRPDDGDAGSDEGTTGRR